MQTVEIVSCVLKLIVLAWLAAAVGWLAVGVTIEIVRETRRFLYACRPGSR